MRYVVPALLVLMLPIGASAEEVQRDWTIERPVLAGFLYGASMTMCRSCRLGHSSVVVDRIDPFAMTPKVRAELTRLAWGPFHIGQLLGLIYTMTVVVGIFFWRLNRLRTRDGIGLTV